MLSVLEFLKTLLGGWRGVVLASLLLAALAWGGWYRVKSGHLEKKNSELSAEIAKSAAVIESQNRAVDAWIAEANSQKDIVKDAQERQLKMAAQFRAGLADQAKRLRFTGQCDPDVKSASEEFARLAK